MSLASSDSDKRSSATVINQIRTQASLALGDMPIALYRFWTSAFEKLMAAMALHRALRRRASSVD